MGRSPLPPGEKKVSLPIYIQEKTADRIKAIAASRGVKPNQFLEEVIAEWLEAH